MPTPLATRPLIVTTWFDSRMMFGEMFCSLSLPRIVCRRNEPSLSMMRFAAAMSSFVRNPFLASGLFSGTQATIWLFVIGSSCRWFDAPERMMMPKSSSSRSSCSRMDIEPSSCR